MRTSHSSRDIHGIWTCHIGRCMRRDGSHPSKDDGTSGAAKNERQSVAVGNRHAKLGPVDAAKNAERDRRRDAFLGEQSMQVVEARHGWASSETMMSPSRRPAVRAASVGLDRDDEHAGRLLEMMEARDAAEERHVLSGDAEIAAPHAAVAQERRQDGVDRVDGDREAQPLAAGDDRGVHADDCAGAGDERAAGVAGIERRVGLDHVLDQPARARAQRPAERAHHAGRHGVLEAVRVADGDRQLAGPERLRVAELDGATGPTP